MINQGPLPIWKQGINVARLPIDAMGRLTKYPLPIGKADSLKVLRRDYEFFTPAILYRFGLITDAPLIDFLEEYRKPVKFFFHRFSSALWSGLELPNGDQDWNHALWALNREHWLPFLDFTLSMAVTMADRDMSFNIALQTLSILDPLSIERKGMALDFDLVDIYALGAKGSEFSIGFVRSNPSAYWEAPAVRRLAASSRMKIFHAAKASGKNPVAAQQNYSILTAAERPENAVDPVKRREAELERYLHGDVRGRAK